MEVTVLNRQRSHRIHREDLTVFLRQLAQTCPGTAVDTLALRLVSDRKMREYNRDFRGRDASTDVLSFPAERQFVPPGERHLGDIVISVTTAAAQAESAGHSLQRELKYLALHGYLHLLGYDHEKDKGTMLRLQQKLRRRLLPSEAAGA